MRLVLSEGIPKVLYVLLSLLLLLIRCSPDVALVVIKFKLFQITNALLESVGGLQFSDLSALLFKLISHLLLDVVEGRCLLAS